MFKDRQNLVWDMLEDLSKKKGITEISINGPNEVFVEVQGKYIQLNAKLSAESIDDFIFETANFNQKSCDNDHPILDGNLPDGSRINIITGPFVSKSASISIRKYLPIDLSFDQNEGIFNLSKDWANFFKAAVKTKLNIIVSGGTGVGKTTFMKLLLKELGNSERVVTIEDTLELELNIPNCVRLESGVKSSSNADISTRDLVKNTLRMRPDRIIIGEIRGGELFDLLQAMNTGHEGSMSSIHANSAGECIHRMETLFLLAGYDVPSKAIKRQIASSIDLVIQLGRNRQGERIVDHILEITGMDGGNILSQVLADGVNGKLEKTGITSKNMQRLHKDGGLPIDFFN